MNVLYTCDQEHSASLATCHLNITQVQQQKSTKC